MPRLPHGINFTPEDARNARKAVVDRIADVSLGFAMVKPVDLRRFDFLFLRLQEDPDNLLPESQDTVEALEALGKAMVEEGELGSPNNPDKDTSRDADFSAAFTYFGQFVDHDITLDADATPGTPPPAVENLKPLRLEDIREQTKNLRTGVFELDSVYGDPAPKDSEDPRKMLIGEVSKVTGNQNKPSARDRTEEGQRE